MSIVFPFPLRLVSSYPFLLVPILLFLPLFLLLIYSSKRTFSFILFQKGTRKYTPIITSEMKYWSMSHLYPKLCWASCACMQHQHLRLWWVLYRLLLLQASTKSLIPTKFRQVRMEAQRQLADKVRIVQFLASTYVWPSCHFSKI